METAERSLNVLEDLKWILTSEGKMSPKEIFLSRNHSLNLDESVAGYVYGAQYRFLMTIYPLLVAEQGGRTNGGLFPLQVVNNVFDKLAPYGDLFSHEDPFLQVPVDSITAEIEGVLYEPDMLPGKLLPQGQSPTDNQAIFWNLDKGNEHLPIDEAVLALVCFYFYGVGTNTYLTPEGKRLKLNKLQNGSSALRYLNSIEIIPQGKGVINSLSMSVPMNFLQYMGSELIPHWADRASRKSSAFDPLWRFSWSSNTVHCRFSADGRYLEAVNRGGVPIAWTSTPPPSEGDNWAKVYHEERQPQDPLYFYRATGEEIKLWRSSLSSDPYYSVAQWHFEELSRLLASKIDGSTLRSHHLLEDLIFLEHATEGSSSSFNIRHSKLIRGWRDEIMPDTDVESMQTVATNVLLVHRRLRGLFTENGTCKHLEPRRRDVEDIFWQGAQSIIEDMVHTGIGVDEANPRIIEAAVNAFQRISSRRDSTNLEAHMRGLQIILSITL